MTNAMPTLTMNDNERTLRASAEKAQPQPLVIPSETLFCLGRREVVILHEGHAYRLRLTRQNKLILTK